MNIIHISPSVLAGAPGMLSDAISDFSEHSSVHFRAGDFGPERDRMSINSFPIGNRDIDREIFEVYYRRADVVHVHNFIPKYILGWISEIGSKGKKFVYQVHSPMFERPIFDDLSMEHGLAFDHRLVVAHFHPRQYTKFDLVPNCLYRQAFRERQENIAPPSHPIDVHFSPSTKIRTRWAQKTSPSFEKALESVNTDERYRLTRFENVSPSALSRYRLFGDVTIDEIITGSFHLVSYEGLAAGTVVINGADDFSLMAFQIGFRSPKPPFVYADTITLTRELHLLQKDLDYLANLKAESRDFFLKWMAPQIIVKRFVEIYEQ